jgi:hypothetical protein
MDSYSGSTNYYTILYRNTGKTMLVRSSIYKRRAALCPKIPDTVAELENIPGKFIYKS